MCSETGPREPVREVPDRNRVPVESAGMADHVIENSKWRLPLKWAGSRQRRRCWPTLGLALSLTLRTYRSPRAAVSGVSISERAPS